MPMHQSIATIDSPEFINLQPLDINPLMEKCEIKVLYIGENRNHSYITKEVAAEMSKTLRGAPIVGYYKESKEDFADHGEKVTFDDEGIHFECMTKPYGFVAPDAEVWFQKFEEEDDFGNSIEREYLMTTGYLWSGQFEECEAALTEGRPQSMELDEKTLNGSWSTNIKSGMEFFIINDAIFSKLCILGEDVEPCFEGANITSPQVSTTFSMDENFKNTLFSMMQDLKKYVSEGGQQMDNLETPAVEVAEEAVETEFEAVEETAEETVETEFEAAEEAVEEEPVASDFAAKEDEKDDASEDEPQPASEEDEDKKEKEVTKNTCGDDDEKKKYSLLEEQYNELQANYAELESRYNELVEFKNQVEDAKKDELINSFSMLSEEDKKEVIENKTNFTYDDIESKLSVIFARKQMSIKNEEETIEEPVVATFNMNDNCDIDSLPNWLKEVRRVEESMNI